MYEFATAIGLDIGRTMIRSAIVRYGGEILFDYTSTFEKIPDKDELIKMVNSVILKLRAEAASQKLNPLCIGIAAKGFIDYRRGIIIGPDQGIKGWTDIHLSEILSRQNGLPVFIDNDANLMAIAEHYNGAARGFNNAVFVALRSGIGGAIIIDGKLYRGANNAGGEIGQMIIDISPGHTGKEIKGSLEKYASSDALVNDYIKKSDSKGIVMKKPVTSLRARDIFDLSYKGDHIAMQVVRDNAEYMGAGLASLVSVFAPDIIVLGGGMSMAKDDYLHMIINSTNANSLEFCRKDVKIVRAKLGFHSSLQGAGIYALTRLDGKYI